jgi:sterol desaturase/sphingolipid hydroxylase (fatty acid hydroxylase superfamily)
MVEGRVLNYLLLFFYPLPFTFYPKLMSEAEIIPYTTAILFCWMGGIIWLERKFPYRKGLPFLREGFWIDFVWYTLIQSYFLKILIFDFIILPLKEKYGLSLLTSHFQLQNWSIWVQVLFFLVIHDFYIYWFHRLQHTNRWFWRTHEAHHSGTEVDWLSGSRSHVVEIIINQTIEFAPIILLGANHVVIPIKALLDATWGMFIHSNINVKSGKLQYFINGPEMHQWHHADNEEVFFANYSTKFAFWDWIFGTAYLPGHKPQKWGIPYKYPKDYFVQHLFSIKRFDERILFRKTTIRKYYKLRHRLINLLPDSKRKLLLPKKTRKNIKAIYSKLPDHFSASSLMVENRKI